MSVSARCDTIERQLAAHAAGDGDLVVLEICLAREWREAEAAAKSAIIRASLEWHRREMDGEPTEAAQALLRASCAALERVEALMPRVVSVVGLNRLEVS
jgi:hypothetical protein